MEQAYPTVQVGDLHVFGPRLTFFPCIGPYSLTHVHNHDVADSFKSG